MSYYQLPLYERFIEMTYFGGFCTCKHVDEVGVFIYHEKGKKLLVSEIRKHLVGRRRTSCVVEAESMTAAIEKFYAEWEGAKIGGENEMAKALWIDRVDSRGKPSYNTLEELPECSRIHLNRNGGITCGIPIHDLPNHPEKDDDSWNNSGEHGMCGLEGYDYPEENCPMLDYLEIKDELPIRTVWVVGKEFRYVSWKDGTEATQKLKEKKSAELRSERIKRNTNIQTGRGD